MSRLLISAPSRARKNEIIEIKSLVSHPMETGFRHSESGRMIPRDIIRLLVCRFNDDEVFRAELHPAIAANPYFAFTMLATESGLLTITCSGDHGFSATASASLTVE